MTKVFSIDGDYFHDMQYVMDTLNSELKPGTKVMIDEGTSKRAKHGNFLNVDLMIHQMQELAYEEFEALSDGYLDGVTDNQKHELANIISQYLDDNTARISFNYVTRTGTMEVTTE